MNEKINCFNEISYGSSIDSTDFLFVNIVFLYLSLLSLFRPGSLICTRFMSTFFLSWYFVHFAHIFFSFSFEDYPSQFCAPIEDWSPSKQFVDITSSLWSVCHFGRSICVSSTIPTIVLNSFDHFSFVLIS